MVFLKTRGRLPMVLITFPGSSFERLGPLIIMLLSLVLLAASLLLRSLFVHSMQSVIAARD